MCIRARRTGIHAYGTAKSAQIGLARQLASELGPFGITVNAVAPGFVVTGMTRGSNSDAQIAERGKTMPLGRFTRPEDISYAVAWLASDEAEMVSGQVVSPNSGEVIVGI